MPKHLARMVCLFLIPCLIVDPVLAAGVHGAFPAKTTGNAIISFIRPGLTKLYVALLDLV
jgi:hypothetical protein